MKIFGWVERDSFESALPEVRSVITSNFKIWVYLRLPRWAPLSGFGKGQENRVIVYIYIYIYIFKYTCRQNRAIACIII